MTTKDLMRLAWSDFRLALLSWEIRCHSKHKDSKVVSFVPRRVKPLRQVIERIVVFPYMINKTKGTWAYCSLVQKNN